jgi:hypothetical protein
MINSASILHRNLNQSQVLFYSKFVIDLKLIEQQIPFSQIKCLSNSPNFDGAHLVTEGKVNLGFVCMYRGTFPSERNNALLGVYRNSNSKPLSLSETALNLAASLCVLDGVCLR